jgi:hypothetical protein
MDSINNSHGDDAAGAIFLVVRYVFILFYLARVFFFPYSDLLHVFYLMYMIKCASVSAILFSVIRFTKKIII